MTLLPVCLYGYEPSFQIEEIRKLVDLELGYASGASMASKDYKVMSFDTEVHKPKMFASKLSLLRITLTTVVFEPLST